MAHITLRPSATWSEALLHWFDAVLDRLERIIRNLFADQSGDFHQAIHAAQVRRMAARGCNGQALM